MPIVKLTPDFIAHNLHCSDGKGRIEFCDTELPGFYVEVRNTQPGQGTFYQRYKNSGTTRHQKIGKTADLSLFEARKQARTLKAQIELGADPRGEERKRKAVMTLDEFFFEKYLPYVQPRKRSWKRDVELYSRISAAHGKKRLHELTSFQISTFHADLLKEELAPATADLHLKFLKHFYRLACVWNLLEKNPCTGIPLFRVENIVNNILNPEELARLMAALENHGTRMPADIVLFLLCTGCRLNEALSAEWENIDEVNRIWRITAMNSKSKRMRSAPLNDTALEILSRVGTKGRFSHVFVNMKTNKRYTAINKFWSIIKKEANLPHYRLHDLRHQYASILANNGHSIQSIKELVGHAQISTTLRYMHLTTSTLQIASNSVSDVIRASQKKASESSFKSTNP